MDKEQINITSKKTEVSPAEIRKLKKAEKKRKKFEKKELKRLKKEHAARAAIVPPSKRPIICPPDCSDAAKNKVYIILHFIFFDNINFFFYIHNIFHCGKKP